MKILLDSFSHAGRDEENQDRVMATQINEITLIGVADGMGGHRAGAIASQLVVDSVIDFFSVSSSQLDEKVMEKCFLFARSRLLEHADEHPEERDLGTTLSILVLSGDQLFYGHSGDSRLYHLRGQGIIALTKDQTELQYLMDAGIVSKRKAKSYKRKNILLSALSPSVDFLGEFGSVKFEEGDRFIAITDGGYSNISKREIKDLSLHSTTIFDLSSRVLDKIEAGKISDDYSAAFLEIA